MEKPGLTKRYKLYHADTLEYCGSIVTDDTRWEYRDVHDVDLIRITADLGLREVLDSLIGFDIVYDIVGE